MTKRTLLLIALATTTGAPVLAACGAASTTQRQAPLPPPVTAAPTRSTSRVGAAGEGAPATAPGQVGDSRHDREAGRAPVAGAQVPLVGAAPGGSGGASTVPAPAGALGSSELKGSSTSYAVGNRAPWDLLLAPPAPPAASSSTAVPADPTPSKTLTVASRPVPEPRSFAPRSSLPALLAVRPVMPAIRIESEPALRPEQAASQEQDGRSGKAPRSEENAGDEVTDSSRQGEDDTGVAQVRPDAYSAAAIGTTKNDESRKDEPQPDHRSAEKKKARAQKSGGRHPHATAARWKLDGLPLGAVSRLPDIPSSGSDNTQHAGTPAFQRALAASRSARPAGAQPDPQALRRWSRTLGQAAAAAPDRRLRRELRSLAHYAQELAKTPPQKRADLATKRPQVMAVARALRSELPQRFGVDLLG